MGGGGSTLGLPGFRMMFQQCWGAYTTLTDDREAYMALRLRFDFLINAP